LIDRPVWRTHGTIALNWTGGRFEESAVRPPGYDRPWARAMHNPATMKSSPARPLLRNATPRAQDLEPGD
jgi:hypothetical protein